MMAILYSVRWYLIVVEQTLTEWVLQYPVALEQVVCLFSRGSKVSSPNVATQSTKTQLKAS